MTKQGTGSSEASKCDDWVRMLSYDRSGKVKDLESASSALLKIPSMVASREPGRNSVVVVSDRRASFLSVEGFLIVGSGYGGDARAVLERVKPLAMRWLHPHDAAKAIADVLHEHTIKADLRTLVAEFAVSDGESLYAIRFNGLIEELTGFAVPPRGDQETSILEAARELRKSVELEGFRVESGRVERLDPREVERVLVSLEKERPNAASS